MKRNPNYTALLLAGLLGAPAGAMAQTSSMPWVNELLSLDASSLTLLILLGAVLGVILLLLVLMIYLMSFLSTVLKREMLASGALAAAAVTGPSWWQQFKERWVTGKLKPVEEEQDLMLDHSYDGIVELDNFMPPWLKFVFYGTIVFAVAYFVNYSVLGIGKTQVEEYEEEKRLAAIQIEAYKANLLSSIDENSVIYDDSPQALQAGKTLFIENCAACHAADGGGTVGPNLTDDYWIHGNSIAAVFKVVKYGVPAKGMIPWEDQLSPEQMQQVSSYVLTLQGTTPANPKAPEGEKMAPTSPSDSADEAEEEEASEGTAAPETATAV
ncbi:cytochrome c class I [Nitritalea halalkaliphila LW7]|uniref:Cytochrome c class I n=1 Tax=Nitritalea halalkaliphila LW7 TaxID=1189621 RepID=I5C463_9BACT|nr:cbb3-type cytochrome c oxidase N-terminal domain-containing protein [Nitritalea halalkaliphila]EIM76615.1 cytochrome c class I [Nitritalea halalkaliphila LW7]